MQEFMFSCMEFVYSLEYLTMTVHIPLQLSLTNVQNLVTHLYIKLDKWNVVELSSLVSYFIISAMKKRIKICY